MADILKLKKKAADFEAKKQMDKALATYREMIDVYERGDEDPIDIPLYNRVGDLLQKAGSLPEAVSIWERAVDHYAEGGFYNPAIALCNKILRQSPGRAVVYYKLGKISAEKGFKGDARQNFLEYASRMQKAGNLDEAFRALKEFADLVPDQDDVRIMLADQLVKADRKAEAIEQLQIAYTELTRADKQADADAVADKMRAIDPTVEPKSGDGGSASKSGGLVFLDLGGPAPAARQSRHGWQTPAAEQKRATKAVQGLDLIDMGRDVPPAPAKPAAELAIEATATVEKSQAVLRKSITGLETTSLVEAEPVAATPSATADRLPGLIDTAAPDLPILDLSPAAAPDLPMLDLSPAAAPDLPMLDLSSAAAPDLQIIEPPSASASDLPLLDPSEMPAPDLSILEMPSAPSRDDTPLQVTAEHLVPADLQPFGERDLPLTTERRIPDPLPLDGVRSTVVQSSDFGAFGAVDDEKESQQFGGFSSLDVESSEGVHSLPLDESYVDLPASLVEAPSLPPLSRPSSVVLANSVDLLRDRTAAAPEDWGLRRQFAEALLDDGKRSEGTAELEVALAGYERDGDLDTAASIAEEIVRLAPDVIRYHQKRVEFAFRANDRMRLAEAYVELADALVKDGQAPKARVVYQRVLEISPDDIRAQAALETIADAPIPEPTPVPRRSTTAVKRAQAAAPAKSRPAEEEFVSLGDWLRDEEEPKSTRMVVEEKEPTGDEQADFADMLRKFKKGVSDNVDDEDHEAHYDLGVAYKEMGLLDEAISEFQKSLRGTANRVRAIEALGGCFLEKQQLPVAATILQRALAEPGVRDDSLIGVLYLLGTISEELHLFPDAKRYYERVFAVDIQFRDVGDRLNAVEKQLK